MKLLIAILATIAVAYAGSVQFRAATRSLNSILFNAIERLRDEMPCGFERNNIPPLAPLKIEHKEVAVDTIAMSVDGEVNKVRVDGLNEFDITELKWYSFSCKLKFGFFWKGITVKGLYNLDAILNSFGQRVEVKGSGDMFLAIKDLNVEITISYSAYLPLTFKEVKTTMTVGDVDASIEGVNEDVNKIIEETILLAVNNNQDFISTIIEEAVLPAANNAVDGVNERNLLEAIYEYGETPAVCIPPKDE